MSSPYKSHGITSYSHFVHVSQTNQKVPVIPTSCINNNHTSHASQFIPQATISVGHLHRSTKPAPVSLRLEDLAQARDPLAHASPSSPRRELEQ